MTTKTLLRGQPPSDATKPGGILSSDCADGAHHVCQEEFGDLCGCVCHPYPPTMINRADPRLRRSPGEKIPDWSARTMGIGPAAWPEDVQS